MSNKNTLPVLLLYLLCFSLLHVNAQRPFVLEGIIHNQDTGKIHLHYIGAKGLYVNDTVAIKDGRFKFDGVISEPMLATLMGDTKTRSVDDPNLTDLYLEPTRMMIVLQKNHFKDGLLTGSKTQNEFFAHNQKVRLFRKSYAPLYRRLDSITQRMQEDSSDRSLAEEALRLRSQLDESVKKEKALDYRFVAEHPSSFVGPTLMFYLFSGYSLDSMRLLFNNLDKRVQNSIYGVAIAKKLSKIESSGVGRPAPPFRAVDMNKKLVDFSRYKGKSYVLLDFWASWCVPCRQASPRVLKLQKAYKDQGLQIIAITYDESKEKWINAIAQDGTGDYIHVMEGGGSSAGQTKDISGKGIRAQYEVPYIPYWILIDKQGTIIGRYGVEKGDFEALEHRLMEIFKQQTAGAVKN